MGERFGLGKILNIGVWVIWILKTGAEYPPTLFSDLITGDLGAH